MDGDFLIDQIKDAMSVETTVFYTGNVEKDVVRNSIKEYFMIRDELRESKSPYRFEKKLNNSNTIYFHNDKKAVQSQIYIIVDGEMMDEGDRHLSNMFNKYFGGSMSGLVFQEIREFRSLAYSAYGTYRRPFFFDESGRFEGFMGTQADKTMDAIETYMSLLEDMPQKANRLEGIQSGLLESLTSSRSNFRSIGTTIRNWGNQGFKEDRYIRQ